MECGSGICCGCRCTRVLGHRCGMRVYSMGYGLWFKHHYSLASAWMQAYDVWMSCLQCFTICQCVCVPPLWVVVAVQIAAPCWCETLWLLNVVRDMIDGIINKKLWNYCVFGCIWLLLVWGWSLLMYFEMHRNVLNWAGMNNCYGWGTIWNGSPSCVCVQCLPCKPPDVHEYT